MTRKLMHGTHHIGANSPIDITTENKNEIFLTNKSHEVF